MFNELIIQHNNLDKIQIKDKFIQGGGGFSYLNYMNILIGIVLITIGLICFYYHKFWKDTDAQIISISSSRVEKKIMVGYLIDDKVFTKVLSVPTNSKYEEKELIKIYYNTKNPNEVKLGMFNHNVTGSLLIFFGIYLIISKYFS